MTRVAFDYDEATAIVVPADALDDHEVAEWAGNAATALVSHQKLTEQEREILGRALIRAHRSAVDDPSTNVLLYEPVTRAWAPLRLTLLDRELDPEEQGGFLRPPALLPPQVRMSVSQGLGPGCSSTVMDDDLRGGVRWLFMPAGRTFFAAVGPLAAPAIALAGVQIEEILDTVRIDGADGGTSPAFDPHAWVDPAEADDTVWRT